MVSVKGNFSNDNKDNMWCKTFQLFTETEEYLWESPGMKLRTHKLWNFQEVGFEMSVGAIKNQANIVESYHIILEARTYILQDMEQ